MSQSPASPSSNPGPTPAPGTLWHPAAGLESVVQTLLDFEQQPGRYALALREPRALFEHTHAVMLLAAGRPVEGLPPLMPGQHTGAVQRAARYFVRTVLLRPGTDHYSLLGLKPGHTPEALRDHYRLMIRLTHPDFAKAAEAEWPADAASRINLANDVLGSAVKRGEYDATLAAGTGMLSKAAKPAKPAAAHATTHSHTTSPPYTGTNPLAPTPGHGAAHAASRGFDLDDEAESRDRSRRRRKTMALAAGGALACATLLWLLSPGHNDGSLVAQRTKGNNVSASANTANANGSPQPTAPMSAIEQAKAELAADAALAEALQTASNGTDTATGKNMGKGFTAASAANLPDINTNPAAPPARRAQARNRAEPGHNADAALAQATRPATRPAAEPASGQPARTWRMSTPPGQNEGNNNNNNNNAPNDGNDSRLALALETGLSLTSTGTTSVTPPGNSLPKASNNNAAALALVSNPATPEPAAADTTTPRLTMDQVQFKLSQVLAGLQSGKGENATQWLDGHWRDHPAAGNFVNAYQRQVAGQRVLQMGKAQFRSRQLAEHFVVDGSVELYLQDAKQVEQVKEMNVSAYFLAKEGRPVLTQLVLNRTR